MSVSGKYIYCVIKTSQDQRFGAIGLQDEEVLTIGIDDLAMVVSHYEATDEMRVRSSRKNLLAHQRVLEAVMEQYTVLPMKFGTMAANEGEIHSLLLRHGKGFRHNIEYLDNKVELGVKASWENMKAIYDEIIEENTSIRDLKLQIAGQEQTASLIQIGQMVEQALTDKKAWEASEIMEHLKRVAVEWREGKPIGDEMFMNVSFLVSKGREKEFDNTLEEIAQKLDGRVKFKYVGPLAPYNFVELGIYPEEWEA